MNVQNSNSQKRSFHHGNLKETLLDASLDILDEKGPDAITIREVARRAGVSHAAPVNHFKDRGTLLTEVAVVLFEALKTDIFSTLENTSVSSLGAIKIFAERLIAFGLSEPNRYRMLWRRDLVNNDDVRLVNAMDSIYDELIHRIARHRTRDAVDEHTIAIGLWSLAHGYVSMRIDGNFEAAHDDLTGKSRQDMMIDLFLECLR